METALCEIDLAFDWLWLVLWRGTLKAGVAQDETTNHLGSLNTKPVYGEIDLRLVRRPGKFDCYIIFALRI